MTNDDQSRKRSLPDPISHAMTVNDFPGFSEKTEYLGMVRVQLEHMKAQATERAKAPVIDQIKDAMDDKDPLAKYDRALIILDFLELSVHNHHTVAGMEVVKQKFLQEVGATRDAISKTAVMSGMGGK